MGENYVKIFPTMYTGSLYGAGMHIFAVWGWILAHKDENGLVEINPKLVADELGGTVEQVEEAIGYLCASDPNSRSPEQEGRRLVKVSQFGYAVVNHARYRDRGGDRTEYWRNYKRGKRNKGVHMSTVDNVDNCGMSTNSTHADADADADIPPIVPQGTADGFDDFWRAYPKKVARAQAVKVWKKLGPDKDLAAKIVAAVKVYAGTDQWQRDSGRYIPHAATFLNQRRWEDKTVLEIATEPTPDLPPVERGPDGLTPRERVLRMMEATT